MSRGTFAILHQHHPVNGSRMWLKSQVFCTIPEQLFEPVTPGDPPLSRWIAQIDSVFSPLELA